MEGRWMWRDTKKHFGWVTCLIHAAIALGFIVQFVLIYYRHFFLIKGDPWRGFLIGSVHKPVGMILFVLGCFFVLWRLANTRPLWPKVMVFWERAAARTTHVLLFLMMLLMPLTGILMSQYAHKKIVFWGGFVLPQWFAQDKAMASWFHDTHGLLSYLILFLFFLHVFAALKHHFWDRDNLLKGMFFPISE
jgi:cytochrome b561